VRPLTSDVHGEWLSSRDCLTAECQRERQRLWSFQRSSRVLHKPQVRLDFSHLAKPFLRVFGLHSRGHNDILSDLPVDGRCHTFPVSGLKTVNHAQNLGGVASRGSRIAHGKPDLFRWINDEHGSNGEGDSLFVDVVKILLVDHVIQERHLPIAIGNDGELQRGAGDLVDVGDPFFVTAQVVGAQTNHLHVSLLKLILQLGECSELGGTDRGEVGGMRKEDRPFAIEPLVEINVAVSSLCDEVGRH